MTARLLAALSLLFISTLTFAQSLRLSGKVTNEKNEAVAGANIIISGGGGTTASADGSFSLSLTPGKKYEITFSASGYTAKVIADIEVTNTTANELNVVLQTAANDLSNITVTATRSTARRETVNSIISFQKNTNTVATVV